MSISQHVVFLEIALSGTSSSGLHAYSAIGKGVLQSGGRSKRRKILVWRMKRKISGDVELINTKTCRFVTQSPSNAVPEINGKLYSLE